MLRDCHVHATLPCSDLQRAKQFYADKLGLVPADEQPGGLFYAAGGGTRFLLFPSSGRASGAHTQMGWRVHDIDEAVRDLTERGVDFEAYNFDGFDPQTRIATHGDVRSAWFRDSEGNLLGLVQLPD
jgi:catechol 2,3-dioxygenase-like lactoylglutathione lyase family enzyme